MIVRSKANSAGAARKASALWQNSYDELDSQKTWAKQSQLPYVQGWARLNKGTGPASGAHYAKQSQFLMGEQEGAGTGKLVHAGAEQIVRNKANSPRTDRQGRQLAKRSQFPGSGRCDGSGIRHRMPATPVVTGWLPLSSHLRWSRLYWVLAGNRKLNGKG